MRQRKIRVERKAQWVNKARAIAIFIDDKKVGMLKDGEVRDFEVSKVSVNISAKLDWCKTPPLEIDLYGSAIAHVEIGCSVKGRSESLSTSLNWMAYAFYGVYWAFFKPSEYLYIKEKYSNNLFA